MKFKIWEWKTSTFGESCLEDRLNELEKEGYEVYNMHYREKYADYKVVMRIRKVVNV